MNVGALQQTGAKRKPSDGGVARQIHVSGSFWILLMCPENDLEGLRDAAPAAKRCLFPLRFRCVFTLAKHLNFKTHPAARAEANWMLSVPTELLMRFPPGTNPVST